MVLTGNQAPGRKTMNSKLLTKDETMNETRIPMGLLEKRREKNKEDMGFEDNAHLLQSCEEMETHLPSFCCAKTYWKHPLCCECCIFPLNSMIVTISLMASLICLLNWA